MVAAERMHPSTYPRAGEEERNPIHRTTVMLAPFLPRQLAVEGSRLSLRHLARKAGASQVPEGGQASQGHEAGATQSSLPQRARIGKLVLTPMPGVQWWLPTVHHPRRQEPLASSPLIDRLLKQHLHQDQGVRSRDEELQNL